MSKILCFLKKITRNDSNWLGLLELKEGGGVDEGREGDVDHEHCPCSGGDLHLTRSIAAWPAQLTDTFPAHLY